MRTSAGRLRGVSAAVLVAALAAGCGNAGPPSRPTGVDQLVVPTPSPRASDFVTVIDNAWLAWTPGASTTFTSAGGPVVQQVSATTTEVAGLAATSVLTTGPGAVTRTDLFAQDRSGNVWWLGREGEWVAGEDGAQAGLWMPAAPRLGDGFRQALAPGVNEDVARVVLAPPADAGSAYDGANVEDGSAGDEVRLRVSTDLDPRRTETRTYVEGRGLIGYALSGTDGDDTVWSLPDGS